MIINLFATWIPALLTAFLGVLKLTGNRRVAEERSRASSRIRSREQHGRQAGLDPRIRNLRDRSMTTSAKRAPSA